MSWSALTVWTHQSRPRRSSTAWGGSWSARGGPSRPSGEGGLERVGEVMSAQLRMQERVPVSLDVVCESASGKRDARMSDISASGCYIDSITQVAVGEVVTFKTRLPTGHWIQLR